MKSESRRYTQSVRAQAAEATGQRIIDAFLVRLMREWYDEIRLDDIAGDAQVTVQTVVRRFGGKDGLLAAAVKTLTTQINARREAPSGDLSSIVDHLIKDYEEVGDAVIRLLAMEPRRDALKEVLDFGRSEHRRWVSAAFDVQLKGLNPKVLEMAIDALVVATDVYTWKLLRRDRGRSVAETAAIMKRLILAAIVEFSKPR